MDLRERREKLEKLASLTGPQVQVMYYRCLDKTVSEITNILKLDNEGTIWTRFTQIFKKLGVSGQEELVLQYSPIFLKYIKSEDDWKNWGHIRATLLEEAQTLSSQSEIEDQSNSAQNAPESSGSQQSAAERGDASVPRRVPRWPLVAILILTVCLLSIAGIMFAWRFIQARNTPVPTQTLPTSPATTQFTSTSEPSSTVEIIATQTALPVNTVTSTLTLTPTSTLTPIPTDTKSPIGLVKGDELSDSRVTLKLTDIQYNQKYDRLGAKVAPISFFFDFTNHSGETIVLQIDSSDFHSVDDTGYEADCWFYHISGAGQQINEPLNNGDTREIVARCGLGNINPNVTTVTLTIHPFTSLPESTWIAQIPH